MRYSSFHDIVKDSNILVMRSLLQKDRTLANRKDEFDGSPLHLAVSLCHHDSVALLLEYGADVGALTKFQRTPLHLAVFEGDLQILDTLLDQGADPDAQDSFGLTSLHLAVLERGVDVCRAILERGADPNMKDLNNRTPLSIALQEGDESIADLLRSYRAI